MKKRAKLKRRIIRGIIQLVFFLMAPAVFTTAFSGVKYIFTQIRSGEQLEAVSFLVVLAAILLYTILFGRYFCGFACAFGSMGDLVNWISSTLQKKTKKKLPRLSADSVKRLLYVKYIILTGIIICCFAGIYGAFKGSSPWDVFSMVTALNVKTAGYAIGILLLFLIVIGMCIEERFFCKFLCPMGAVFALLPILPPSSLQRKRESCIPGCSACEKNCPVKLEIDGDTSRAGECFQCNKCLAICPKANISTGWGRQKGNETAETVIVVLKGILLFIICYLLKVNRI